MILCQGVNYKIYHTQSHIQNPVKHLRWGVLQN